VATTTAPPASEGFFPLDAQLELGTGVWSESLEQEMVWLSAAVGSFELAETIMQRIGRKSISCSSIWRCTQAAGERFRALEARERQLANGLPELWDPPSRGEVADQRKGVALDGALIYIRDEQWKELKIGDVFDVAVQPTRDSETGEVVDLAHAVNNRYVAHLGGPEVLGELLWAEARCCGWEQAQDTIVLGDGAVWIWNQAALHFGRSHQLVDWYHARQHLVEAARLLKAEGTSSHQRWLNSRTTLLYQGHAARIADELDKAARKPPTTTNKSGQTTKAAPAATTPKSASPAKQEALAREATYFRTNQLRMNYLEMREEEWPIGSGVIESGAKQFKARFTGPGMRWSRQGAENLIPLRAAVLSNHFDASWAAAKNLPPA
jgi:hypothetical protein